MEALEAKIDEDFNANPILELPFCMAFNLMCEITALHLVETGTPDSAFLTPFMFIFEKDNFDFTPMSTIECRNRLLEIEHRDFDILFQCATLNQVFPLLHAGVYKFERTDNESSSIFYASEEIAKFEIRDEVLTHLSLPFYKNSQGNDSGAKLEFHKATKRRLSRSEPLQVLKGKTLIKRLYELNANSFSEAFIVPDSFYCEIGFSSPKGFRDTRRAFLAICEAYLLATQSVYSYLEVNQLIGSAAEKDLYHDLAMVVAKKSELRSLVNELTKSNGQDFEKFTEFFFSDADNRESISKRFLPPFWNLQEQIYFSPGATTTLLSSRNLVISIMNNKSLRRKYNFDKKISREFEPILLNRAKEHFESNGYNVFLGKDIGSTEIDLLAYCERTSVVLLVQAKATLYPEGARMVKNLERRINEAITQHEKFDTLSEIERTQYIVDCFPHIIDTKALTYQKGVLVNSSFGSYKSWNNLESARIQALNCNILKNVLPKCDGLAQLPDLVDKYIERVTKLASPTLEKKVFRLKGHTINQEKWEIDTSKLYRSGLYGE